MHTDERAVTAMPRTIRRSRQRERGQVLPIIALSGVVLIGVTALAVDLSLQTNTKRQIQNVADAASLAGAHDLYSSGGSVMGGLDQANAVTDALNTVQDNLGWTTADLAGSAVNCSGYPTTTMTLFGLSGVCRTVTANGATITASTPPKTPVNIVDVDTHDVEVDIAQTEGTNFAAVIGFASASEKAHAVARHGSPGVTTGFALFANQYVETGNSISVVNGNVYAGRAVNLQASGQSSFCANSTAGNDDGYIILGAPQFGDTLPAASTQGQHDMKPTTSDTIVARNRYLGSTTACTVANLQTANLLTPNLLGYVVQSGAGVQSPPQTCPTISGAGPALYNASVGACEVTPIVLPPAPQPYIGPTTPPVTTYGSPSGSGSGCKTGHEASCWRIAPADGVYVVYHATSCVAPSCFDLQITKPMTLNKVTVWLKPGASFGVNLTGGGGAVVVNGPYSSGTTNAGDGRYVVYGESGSAFSVVGGNTSVELKTGSIVMPSGTVTCSDSTAALLLDSGQAVADTWNVSSGNQPNPQITYNSAYAGVSSETLRLVE